MSDVAVFGIGYVGCVTAACLSRDGNQVVGVDVDASKVAMLNAGQSPVAEPGLDQLIQQQVAAGRLSATEDLAAAVRQTAIGMITVGTPSGHDGAVSVAAVQSVVREIGRVVGDSGQDYLVLIRSTLLPGVLETQLGPLLEEVSGRALGGSLRLCNNPEFLRESSALADYDRPPYVLIGRLGEENVEDVWQLYEKIDAEKIVADTRTAAMVKYACNAYHATKIAFANEIGSLAQTLQADGQQVMQLVCRDTKLNVSSAYLRPGFAFGGSCLPKDLRALNRYAEKEAVRTNLLSAILPSNQQHLQRGIDRILRIGRRRVGLVGLSFKAGTDDLRESPFVSLAETLIGRGCDVKIYDPGISISRLKGRNLAYIDQHLPHLAALLVESAAEIVRHAELVVLGTSVGDDVDWQTECSGELIDLRRDLVAPSPPASAENTPT